MSGEVEKCPILHVRPKFDVFTLFCKPYLTSCIKWASTQENMTLGDCEQQRPRPACATAQTDQRLCHSLFGGKYHI